MWGRALTPTGNVPECRLRPHGGLASGLSETGVRESLPGLPAVPWTGFSCSLLAH
ncbi:hypothetical protein SXCC_04289 [Gluconacetobacter sp. SXCC-1]|nr:hypothetical protein SXCC_04289 [Gluconacetobacter sp. SXCC-1]